LTGVPKPIERIGVVLVHGIGEQGRFEHLEHHVRPLIEALKLRAGPNRNSKATVEIIEGATSTLHAQQQTWACGPGPSVRATVVEGPTSDPSVKEISFHEVWWADVNEPYSLGKQVRFWLWGLSVWLYPPRARARPGRGAMQLPIFPPDRSPARMDFTVRAKLLGVANVFLMAAFSIGIVTFLLKRLLDFSAPSIIRIFVNYISGVKLFVQPRRAGGEFLDALEEAPRVSVRRRMVRTLVDVALADPSYDRWYIFAHSLGTIAAFNGLMENCQALPNYLDQERWDKLRHRLPPMAGPAGPNNFLGPIAEMFPARTVWLADNDVVYREVLFERFRGFLSYGSPLDKFAAIWADRVPINVKEPAFQPGTEWINVYDPTDPVSASLDAYTITNPATGLQFLPPPINLPYRAHLILLLSHVRYLQRRPNQVTLSDTLASWLIDGGQFAAPAPAPNGLFITPGSTAERRRLQWARLTWLIVYIVLTLLATAAVLLGWEYVLQPFLMWACEKLQSLREWIVG
jgi:hypothetical protein